MTIGESDPEIVRQGIEQRNKQIADAESHQPINYLRLIPFVIIAGYFILSRKK